LNAYRSIISSSLLTTAQNGDRESSGSGNAT
jgi:hypothetical protein